MVLLNNEEIIAKLRILKVNCQARDKDPRTPLEKLMDEFLRKRWEEQGKSYKIITGAAGVKAFDQALKDRFNGKSFK